MKIQSKKGNHTRRSFLLIALSLLIVVPLCSGACVTANVIDYAKNKASPLNVTEFTIGKVHSASLLKNGDLSILAELDSPNHPKSGLYAMTVSLPSLMENAGGLRSFGFRTQNTPSISGLPGYLYPMAKAKKFRGDLSQKDTSSSSIFIEELNLRRDEADRLLELLGDRNRDPSGEEKVYAVNFLSDEAAKAVQEDTGKTVEEKATVNETILLVYSPLMSSSSLPQPIAIAGAYEDESTNLYYLLVPPAIALDCLVLALQIVAQGGGSSLIFR